MGMVSGGLFVLLLELPLWSSQMQAFPTAVTMSRCIDGYYKTGVGCSPCSVCLSTEVVVHPCTNTANTVCLQCSLNSTTNPQYIFQDDTATVSHCRNCTTCADLHREQIAPCSSVKDSACGGCLDGFFLGVTSEGQIKCLPCSWCPPNDDTAIKWRECQDAGLNPDMWCSPGYSSSSDEPAHFNSSSTATHEVLSGGNFLSFTFQSTIHSLSNETSLSSSLIVVIVILTVVATAITLIGTVCSVTLCIIQRCRQASRNYYRVRAECPSTPMEEQTGQ